ncbi:hypothetical protein ACIOYT_00695 [Streptomyces halstedii]|uniref:hypothetical protein n=1 Tax=Streptomyces halstedii TaxID=1944 RepID=UPI0038236B43
MTTQTETTTQTPPLEFVELVTTDGTRYRKGRLAPAMTVTTSTDADIPATVISYTETEDWAHISLSGGYVIGIPEARIAHIIARTA